MTSAVLLPPRCLSGHTCTGHQKYGLDCVEYAALRARSGGCCELCGAAETDTRSGRLIIDHDHDYGHAAVRGLICYSCNSVVRDADYTDPTRRSHNKPIARYLANAWFMQVLLWARANDGLLGLPDDEQQSLEASALRVPAIRRLSQLFGMPCETQAYMAIAKGSADLHLRAVFQAPGAVVASDVVRRAGRQFANDHFEVAVPGRQPIRAASLPQALSHVPVPTT